MKTETIFKDDPFTVQLGSDITSIERDEKDGNNFTLRVDVEELKRKIEEYHTDRGCKVVWQQEDV